MAYPRYRRRAAYGRRRTYRRKAPMNIVRGRGAYFTNKSKAVRSFVGRGLRTLGSVAGGYIGGRFGSGGASVGARIGRSLGAKVSKFVGAGAYSAASKVKYNTLVAQQVPFMHSTLESTRIRHREYIADILGMESFTNVLYNINPGVASTFPWLSNLAQNFEQYRFHGLAFYFRTTSGDAVSSTNAALGSVIQVIDYNAGSAAFTSKQQMLNSMWAESCKPSVDSTCFVECERQQNVLSDLYIRGAAVPSGQDIRLYDIGTYQIAVDGMQANSVNIGELHVIYDIELKKPITSEEEGDYLLSAHYESTNYTNSTVLGTQVAKYDSIGLTVSSTVITLPTFSDLRNFYISVQWTGSGSVTATIPSVTLGSNLTALTIFQTDTASKVFTPGSTASSVLAEGVVLACTVNPSQTSANNTITFGTAVLPSTATSCDIFVFQMNPNLTT